MLKCPKITLCGLNDKKCQPILYLGTLVNLFTGQKPRGNEDVVSLSAKTIIRNWIYMYVHIHKRYHICLNVPYCILKHTAPLVFFSYRFLNPKVFFSNLNLNCFHVLDPRKIQEQVKKAFCFKNFTHLSLFE